MNPSPSVASCLQPRQRQDLAVKVLSKKSKISHLAAQQRVSRKFLSERVGKSPTELMTGEKHPHWLEMLGFELFQRA